METERRIYNLICQRDGIKAREIARTLGLDKTTVNRALYGYPFIKELCVRDDACNWYGLIAQTMPHRGLGDFTGWYGTVGEFRQTDEETFFRELTDGCTRIGRNLNDTRGLFHSFRDTYRTMRRLFADLDEMTAGEDDTGKGGAGLTGTGRKTPWTDSWEIAFELRINRSRHIRIYADVLLITPRYVFSLEFKMKDKIEEDELRQAAKYVPYLEILFGPETDVIPALVLTGAEDLYTYRELPGTTAEVPVCSGDMLFNLADEYLRFLNGDIMADI